MTATETITDASRPRSGAPIPDHLASVFLDSFLWSTAGVSTKDMHLVIELDGGVDDDLLKRATRISLDQDPILGCLFVEGWYRPRWVRHSDLGSAEFFSVVEGSSITSDVENYVAQERDAASTLPVEVRLFRAERDTLVIKFSHVTGDASALFQYAYRLASIYCHLGADPSYRPEPVWGDRSFRQLAARFPLRDRLRILGRLLRNKRRRARLVQRFPAGTGSSGSRVYLRRRVPAERMRAVAHFARQRRATVAVVLQAAFARALLTFGAGPVSLPFTVDLRKHLPDPERLPSCNLSGAGRLQLDLPADAPLDQVVSALRDQVKQRNNPYLGLEFPPFAQSLFPLSWMSKLVPYAVFRRLIRRVLRRAAKSGTVVAALAYVGDLDGQKLTFGSSRPTAVYGGNAIHLQLGFGVVALGFQGGLTVTVGFGGGLVDRTVMERLLDTFIAELPDATAVHA